MNRLQHTVEFRVSYNHVSKVLELTSLSIDSENFQNNLKNEFSFKKIFNKIVKYFY